LQDLIRQGTDTASGALSQIQNLSGQDLTAGFSPDQIAAQNRARGVAGGAGGFIPTAQDQTLQTAEGRSLQDILNPDAFGALTGQARGSGLGDFLNPDALSALQGTARGDFLHGGEGFQAALDAGTREAQRAAANAFGGTAGGVGSGLSRAAVGEGTADQFSRLFGQERSNMLGAANSLAGLSDAERDRRLSSAGILSNFSNAERNRQENAVGNLPDVGLAGSNILGQIGSQIQGLDQRRLDAPLQQQLQLLMAALGVSDPSDLFGQSGNSESSGFNFGFGPKA
jgi:hypothetical protein